MIYQYKTTSECWNETSSYRDAGERIYEEEYIPDPVYPRKNSYDPTEEGWEMVGSAATSERLFWFWRKQS